MIGLILGSLLMGLGQGSATPEAVVRFQFDRPALRQPGYELELHSDGRLIHKVSGSNENPDHAPASLQVSAALTGRIFAQAGELSRFDYPCASKRKGIADTGVKTLSYKGQDGAGSCTYNYSENKTVQTLTDEFQGMALMLEEGRKLESEHKYDRLALFGEMTTLVGLVKDGRALEPGLISGVLRSLVADPDVLEKVRTKASELLGAADTGR